MSTLDPFALLGVTIDSTPEDAKASFRSMALLVHPDKQQGGGSPEQMKELLKAYKFVMQQLNLVNRANTVENLERDFAEFCKAQKDADLDLRSRELREIIIGVEEAANLENEEKFRMRFNEAFDAKMIGGNDDSEEHDDEQKLINDAYDSMIAKGGYGSNMVKSEYAAHDLFDGPPVYKDVAELDPPVHPVHPVEPKNKNNTLDPGMNTTSLIETSTMQLQMGRIFGNARQGLNNCMSDYGEAFGGHSQNPIMEETSGTLDERLAKMEALRKDMDIAVQTPMPPWLPSQDNDKNSQVETKVVKSNIFSNVFSMFWR